jgi:2-oxoglutarate dehydrogenase E2 component (dihydrolipoamide succinyltransferase)
MRSTYKDLFAETHDVKLGFMSAFVKASVVGLREMPAVNSYIEGNEVVYHDYCDISVAVATPTGLVCSRGRAFSFT